jgi:hypothetical protein
MSASAAIAKRRVQTIASSFKIQNNNTTLSTLTAFRGAQACPPLNYTRIRYFKPNCRQPCIIPPIVCIPAGVLDGGVVGVNTIDGGDSSGYSVVWDGGSPGNVGTTVYDGNTEGNQFASGGSPGGPGGAVYDGGSVTQSGNTVYDGGNTVNTGATPYFPTYTFDGGDPFQTGVCIYDGNQTVTCVTASRFDGGEPLTTFTNTFDGGSGYSSGQCIYTGGSP